MTSMRKNLEQGNPSFALNFLKDGNKRCCIKIDEQGRFKCDMMAEALPREDWKLVCGVCILHIKDILRSRGFY